MEAGKFHLDAGVFMSKLNPVFFRMTTKANLGERDMQVQ